MFAWSCSFSLNGITKGFRSLTFSINYIVNMRLTLAFAGLVALANAAVVATLIATKYVLPPSLAWEKM